jgi:hypothetical protein
MCDCQGVARETLYTLDTAIVVDSNFDYRNSTDVDVVPHDICVHLDVLYLSAHLRFFEAFSAGTVSFPTLSVVWRPNLLGRLVHGL